MADLSPLWIKQNLEKAQQELVVAEIAYCALKDKRSKFAQGILRVLEAKKKIVQAWREA